MAREARRGKEGFFSKSSVNIMILDFQAPGLWKNQLLCL